MSVAEGETVEILGGTTATDAEVRGLIDRGLRYYGIALDHDLNLRIAPADWPGIYGNHSCDPNLWLLDAVTLAARRDIARGEELTSDYATLTGFADWLMSCSCGTPLCRAVVRGTDWHDPELQRRYRGHFSPFLNERIAAGADSETPSRIG